MKPFSQSVAASRSSTSAITTSAGTSLPASMSCRAACPIGVPLCRASRNMSPVEICGTPKASCSKRACVPLPAPGGPNLTRRIPIAGLECGHAS
jgi:hypothetical protein